MGGQLLLSISLREHVGDKRWYGSSRAGREGYCEGFGLDLDAIHVLGFPQRTKKLERKR
jgi:hypothetical protein